MPRTLRIEAEAKRSVSLPENWLEQWIQLAIRKRSEWWLELFDR